MINDPIAHSPLSHAGIYSQVSVTPTPAASEQQAAQLDPPIGWVFAGILLILLLMMLYQNIKRFVLKVLKKDKPASRYRK